MSRMHTVPSQWFVRWSFIAIGVFICSSWAYAESPQDKGKNSTQRTWRAVSELSEEERGHIDFSTNTPRDVKIPYLPAEAYPFTSPYTAEEMGFRAMEFPHMPRWNCVQIEDGGILTPTGYLSNSKNIVLVNYREPAGLLGHLTAEPGEFFSRWLAQDLAPPENYGNQMLFISYRTDKEKRKKADLFVYSPTLRRVRRFPQPLRQEKMAGWPLTYDDSVGRDAWEFTWRILGADVLHETVRFPVTRQTITLGSADGSFTDVATKDLKIMGDGYEHYNPDGSVPTYVIEAQPKAEWLPDYYASKIIYWLDQHHFYPLRIEVHGPNGELIFVEERTAKIMNPDLGNRGYHNLIAVWWDAQQDFYGYSVHDAMNVKSWSQEDLDVFFSPDFMRRGWFPEPLKTQAAISSPEEFFLRPYLYKDKFPEARNFQLPADLEARIRAQNAAGQIVFEDEELAQATAAAPVD